MIAMIRRFPRSIMIVVTIILSALMVSMPQAVRATSSLGLDGVGNRANGCCGSQLLTTSNPNDVIVLVVECGYTSCDGNVSSITDSSGLSYTLRTSYAPNDKLWEYYAIAFAPLSSDNITVVVSGWPACMMLFDITGANTATVFDIAPSLPASTPCTGAFGDCTISAETSAVDFVIASTAINDAGACKASTGFTEVTQGGGALDVDYQIVDASGSKTYFTCSGTEPTSIVLDALVSSDSLPHAPIFIDGNDGFTADNGVTGGTGTSDDPYVISGWTIQAQDYGIEIANTTAYLTITNVTISWGGDGIVLSSIQNVVVQNSRISVYGDAIRVDNSENFQITTNDIYSGNGHGISLYTSTSFDLSYNTLGGGPFAITGSYLSDASIVGNTGGAEDGINLDHLSGLLISQNSMSAHTPISVYSCSNVSIDSNSVTSPNAGITVSNCDNVLVSDNTASNPFGGASNLSEEGIWITGSNNITIISNAVSYSFSGILLSDFATGNTVTNNVISNNQCGIQTDSSSSVDQNYVADNTFEGNAQDYCGQSSSWTVSPQATGGVSLGITPWPMFRHDPSHTGLSSYLGAQTYSLKWAFDAGGTGINSAPAIDANGNIYVQSTSGYLYAVDQNGGLKWSFPTFDQAGVPSCCRLRSSPAIDSSGGIYVGSSNGELYSLFPNGTLNWSFSTSGPIQSSPAIGSDGTIYVGSSGTNLYAISPIGTIEWSFKTGGAILSSPILGPRGSRIYVVNNFDLTGANYLFAINRIGRLEWKMQLTPPLTPGQRRHCFGAWASPALGPNGTVYLDSGCGFFDAVNLDGSLSWSIVETASPYSSAAIGSDGTIYVGTNGPPTMLALNPDGTSKWGTDPSPCIFIDQICGRVLFSSPTIGPDGTIYIGTDESNSQYHGTLLAIS